MWGGDVASRIRTYANWGKVNSVFLGESRTRSPLSWRPIAQTGVVAKARAVLRSAAADICDGTGDIGNDVLSPLPDGHCRAFAKAARQHRPDLTPRLCPEYVLRMALVAIGALIALYLVWNFLHLSLDTYRAAKRKTNDLTEADERIRDFRKKKELIGAA